MSTPTSIADLAASLVERVATSVKTASAPAPAPVPAHPLAVALKQAAEELRKGAPSPLPISAVQKLAAVTPVGGAPSMANAAGAIAPPKMPKPTNVGAVAGGGGVEASAKTAMAQEFRRIAAALRAGAAQEGHTELQKAAHVLNAAVALKHLEKIATRSVP